MSHFSGGQLNQLGDKLELAGWQAEDLTNFGQASVERLTEIRLSLTPQSEIVRAIEAGQTELWLAPGQEAGWVLGSAILAHLKENGLLAGCPDLGELKTVQAQGMEFFRKHGFSRKAVVGWGGVRGGIVPCLVGRDDEVVLSWRRLGRIFNASDPALRRK